MSASPHRSSPHRSSSQGGSNSPRSRARARDFTASRTQSQSSASSQGRKSNSSSFFTFPVTHTVNSLLRRLSGDTDDSRAPPRSTGYSSQSDSLAASLQSLSSSTTAFVANASSTLSSAAAAAAASYAPAPPQPRKLSPFQPPPLTPLTLSGWAASTLNSSKLLTRTLAEEIRLLLPARLQLVPDWQLAFSLEQDGVSLATLYQKCDEYRGKRGGFVLVVKDSIGGEFGAYITDVPRPSPHYYGTGECFLWRASVLPAIPDMLNLPPPPSADTTHATRMTTLGRNTIYGPPPTKVKGEKKKEKSEDNGGDGATTPDRIRFKAFPYSGINDYMIFCETGYLSVGGGDGHYGLWLDDSLEKGISQTCPTFGNEPLSDEGAKFDVLGVEMWHIG